MENKQTAVDWLYNKLQSECLIDMADGLFQQAKAMEKEQIKDAFEAGIGLDKIIDDCDSIFEIFYEETYGK